MPHTARILCSSALDVSSEGTLPTEFRIFKKGWNETTKGNLLFDDQAAAAVMAQYRREGVDLIVDLNHDSLNKAALAARADASDARGWYQLELREGELWAVNVRWAPDGARRLAEKTQRYISPVALYDAETKRVAYVANVALCAMPATLGAAPLVAASKTPACAISYRMQRFSKAPMSPELLKKILAAIADGKDESGLLGEIVAAAAGGESADPAPADPLAAAADPATAPADPEKPAVAASVSALAKALGCSTDEEAAQVVVKLQKSVQAQADANAAVELETRRGLIAELVKLGVEKPATAWKGDADKRVPADRLTVEPIAELRARVELHKADGPRGNPEPPAGGATEIATEVAKLSKETLVAIAKKGMTPEQFIAERRGVLRSAQ